MSPSEHEDEDAEGEQHDQDVDEEDAAEGVALVLEVRDPPH
jgi:hypothetical protein